MSQFLRTFFEKYFLFFAVALHVQLLQAIPNSQLKVIPIKIAFKTTVDHPSSLSLCAEKIWTISQSKQNLVAINSQSGKVESETHLPTLISKSQQIDAGALACYKNKLILVVNSKSKGILYQFEMNSDKIKISNRFSLPSSARATDLFCNLSNCWLLQEKPFITADLTNWKPVAIPTYEKLKKIRESTDADPFDDWQSTLVLGKNIYHRGAINAYGQAVLINSARLEAVVQKGNEWKKWGRYGAWEGSFLAPKALTFISEDTLAIADSRLKVISLFTFDGHYLGVLSLDGQNVFSLQYPLGLAADVNRIFVADFSANSVIAIDVDRLKTNVTDDENDLNIRKNLFRREEVFKDTNSSLCLNCHDGTVSNHLNRFITMQFHHPLECTECHSAHHDAKIKHFLRVPEKEICQKCHLDYAKPKTNHVWAENSKKGGQCIDCHQSHTNSEKLLIMDKSKICISCHADRKATHQSLKDFMTLERSKNVFTLNGELLCQTCHQTHINWKETKFIKPPEPILQLCSSCHGDKAVNLFKDFHKLMKNKKSAK